MPAFRSSLRVVLAAAIGAGFLSGCGSAGISGVPLAANARPNRAASWMGPVANGSKALLYVSDAGADAVNVYSFPQGQLAGTLTGFDRPQGECTDDSGRVWITTGSQIVEYAHGGTHRIARLSDGGQYPVACSIDSATGDLAVANLPVGSEAASVAIYKHAQGLPAYYFSDLAEMFSLSYDDKGNIFADGIGDASQTMYAELVHGKSAFTDVRLDVNINWPGGVSWDGRHVAVGDQYPQSGGSTIYQTIGMKILRTVQLTTPVNSEIQQFAVTQAPLRKLVACPESNLGSVAIFHYPSGGTPVRTITGLVNPVGAAISE